MPRQGGGAVIIGGGVGLLRPLSAASAAAATSPCPASPGGPVRQLPHRLPRRVPHPPQRAVHVPEHDRLPVVQPPELRAGFGGEEREGVEHLLRSASSSASAFPPAVPPRWFAPAPASASLPPRRYRRPEARDPHGCPIGPADVVRLPLPPWSSPPSSPNLGRICLSPLVESIHRHHARPSPPRQVPEGPPVVQGVGPGIEP